MVRRQEAREEENKDDEKITYKDLQDAGYCTTGSRAQLNLKGVSFRDFCYHGMEVDRARELGLSAVVDHILHIRTLKREQKR